MTEATMLATAAKTPHDADNPTGGGDQQIGVDPASAAVTSAPAPGPAKATTVEFIQEDQYFAPQAPPMARRVAPAHSVLLVVDISSDDVPYDLHEGLAEVVRHSPHKNVVTTDDMESDEGDGWFRWYLTFCHDIELNPGQLSITSSHPDYFNVPAGEKFQVRVNYRRTIEAFRGFGIILAALCSVHSSPDFKELLSVSEEAQFETLGVMVDCSRGAVMLLDTVCYLLRCCALMGINMLQLYTEDTYEIEGEPFFGFLRGRYTQAELRAIDNYAHNLGIEVVPCIQTLGHLGQILQWPRFHYLRDTSEVLLAKSENTYLFIEKMIDATSKPFRSKRIHIGMDEAHGIGEGRFRAFFGRQDSSRIFVDHLERVNQICKAKGLQPMIWSDMLFCLAAKNNSLQGYYGENVDIAADVTASLPNDVELVYWDYYHTCTSVYSQKIAQHRELGCTNPWVAGGTWTWNRLWCALPFTFEATSVCMRACKAGGRGMRLAGWQGAAGGCSSPARDESGSLNEGVRNCLMTIWGDEGNECDILSALPGLMYYAAHGYTPSADVDMRFLRKSFAGICGADFDSWVYASRLDSIISAPTPVDTKTHFPPNTAKWLLWEDPFLSFLSPQYEGFDLETHYQMLAEYLLEVIEDTKDVLPFNRRLQFPALVASVLSLKCHLRERLVEAYRMPNVLERLQALHTLTQGRVRDLRDRVEQLWLCHRDIWHGTNKPFGWEVLEVRYGGLRARLDTMLARLAEYVECNGGAPSGVGGHQQLGQHRPTLLSGSPVAITIPELEIDIDPVYKGAGINLVLDYRRVATPSRPG